MVMNLNQKNALPQCNGPKKGWNYFLIVLIFIPIMIVSMLSCSLASTPAIMVLAMKNPEYIKAFKSGDGVLMGKILQELGSSTSAMVISLLSEIVMIGIVLLFCFLIWKRKPSHVGFVKKGILAEYGLGMLVGFVVFSSAVLLAIVTGSLSLSAGSFTMMIPLLFLGFMIQGMAEEVLCRGFMMCAIAQRYPLWLAIITNAVVFAALHLANPGMTALAFINLTLYGIFSSLYFARRGNIWGIGAFHSVWNFIQGSLYGLQVSGTNPLPSVFSSTLNENSTMINGGSFGLEGGLAVTIVMVLGSILLIWAPWEKKQA